MKVFANKIIMTLKCCSEKTRKILFLIQPNTEVQVYWKYKHKRVQASSKEQDH